MKKIFTAIFLLFVTIITNAQIPNAGFESWVNNSPEGWLNIYVDAVTPSTDAHSGSSAARMESKIVTIAQQEVLVFPWMQTFFPVNQRPESLTGYYKFSPHDAEDFFTVDIILFTGNYIFGVVGSGTFETNTEASTYTQFTVPIEYIAEGVPDSAWLFITISDQSENEEAGSVALVDDLAFGGPTSVGPDGQNPAEFKLVQNYPNPFNPSTTIEFSVAEESLVELKIYDMLGKEVSVLTKDFYPAGNYKMNYTAENLSSGIYIVKMNATSGSGSLITKSMKMNLIK